MDMELGQCSNLRVRKCNYALSETKMDMGKVSVGCKCQETELRTA
jgi:hypothetical protein